MFPPDRVERGLARLAEVVPGLGRMRKRRVWSGVEGYLPDMLPVIGWSGTTPGLLHAFGFSRPRLPARARRRRGRCRSASSTGKSETPIEAFSIQRFAAGFVPDEKLWSEFDPELVATFRQQREEAGHA